MAAPSSSSRNEGAARPSGGWGCPPEPAFLNTIAVGRIDVIAVFPTERASQRPTYPTCPATPRLLSARPSRSDCVERSRDGFIVVVDWVGFFRLSATFDGRSSGGVSAVRQRSQRSAGEGGARRRRQAIRKRREMRVSAVGNLTMNQRLRAKLRGSLLSLHPRPGVRRALPAISSRACTLTVFKLPPKAAL